MEMDRRKKGFSILLLLALLIPYVIQLGTLFPTTAEAVTETQVQLVDNEWINVTVDQTETETGVDWVVTYQKRMSNQAESSGETTRLKFQFGDAEAVALPTGWVVDGEWQVEGEYSATAVGQILVTTAKESVLTIAVQLDKKVLQEVTEAVDPEASVVEEEIISEEGAGESHGVVSETRSAPVTATQIEEIVTENILSEDEAGPHALPPVLAPVEEEPEATTIVETTTEEITETTTTTEEVIEEPATIARAFSAPVTTQQTTNEEDVFGPVEEGAGVATAFSNGLQASAMAVDTPFAYTTDGSLGGKYPTHGTNLYLPGSSSDNTIKNYDYGSVSTSDEVDLASLGTDSLTFASGYHQYGYVSQSSTSLINLKKTVIPTKEENIFKVQLDTIGDAIKPLKQVDVALVIDKSGSMKGTPWSQLTAAVKSFAAEMLDGGLDVRIGLAAFGGYSTSQGKHTTSYAYGAIGDFGTNWFTASQSALNDHALLKGTPVGGTPTFLGVDAGIELLTNGTYGARSGATKVLIVLTDGVPTYYPGTSGNANQQYNQGTSTASLEGLESEDEADSDYTMFYGTPSTNTKIRGTGSSTDTTNVTNSKAGTLSFLTDRYNVVGGSFEKYAIGFNVGNTMNDILLALAGGTATHVFKAGDEKALADSFKAIVSEYVYSISNAMITDPISKFVTLKTGNGYQISEEALQVKANGITAVAKANSFASDFELTTSNETLSVSNVRLGVTNDGANSYRQGYRLTYYVELKEDYRDGSFYPTNEATYLSNGNSTGQTVHYAVPSVRCQVADLQLTKKDGVGNRLTGATFVLQQGDATKYTFTDNEGVHRVTKVQPGIYQLEETEAPAGFEARKDIGTVVVATDGKVTFENQTVKSDDGIHDLGTITNTLKKITVIVNKTDGEKALAGAEFTLTGPNDYDRVLGTDEDLTQFTFTDLTPGTYTLAETKAPAGFISRGEIGKLVITAAGEVTFKGDDIQWKEKDEVLIVTLPDVVNQRKQIDLTFKKVGEDGKGLVGAEFELRQGENIAFPFTEGTDGTFTLENVAPGTYDLYETKAPDGYLLDPNPTNRGVLIIDEDGTATFEGKAITAEAEENRMTFNLGKIANKLKPFELTIKKTDKTGAVLSGATFEAYLEDSENAIAKAVSETGGLATFMDIEDEKKACGFAPGTYQIRETLAPAGYRKLSGTFTLVIATDGTATVNYESQEAEAVTVELMSGTDNNQLTFTITNDPTTPLPKTGGSGSLIYLITAGILIGISGLYFLKFHDRFGEGGGLS